MGALASIQELFWAKRDMVISKKQDRSLSCIAAHCNGKQSSTSVEQYVSRSVDQYVSRSVDQDVRSSADAVAASHTSAQLPVVGAHKGCE